MVMCSLLECCNNISLGFHQALFLILNISARKTQINFIIYILMRYLFFVNLRIRGPLSKNASITFELSSFCFGRKTNIDYLHNKSPLMNRLKELLWYFSYDQILWKYAFRLKIDYRIVKSSDNRCWNPRPIPITSISIGGYRPLLKM